MSDCQCLLVREGVSNQDERRRRFHVQYLPSLVCVEGGVRQRCHRGLETAAPRSTIAPNPIAWPQLTTQFPRVNLELYDAKRPGPVADRLGSERNTVGSTCVVGLQWGDEAKGKIVDLLCDQHDVVVRDQGGANAGHTVVHEGVTYKLSLVPTGVLRQGIDCVIGNGVVIHPPALLAEIERLSAQGVAFGDRLHISDRCM